MAAILGEKLPCVSNDIAADPCTTGRVQAAVGLGILSWALSPLAVGGHLIGALALYAGEKEGFFDAEETKLCNALAADSAYAMEFTQHKEELEFPAYYNSLTGLPSRRRFSDVLEQQMTTACSSGQRLAVLVIDLAKYFSVSLKIDEELAAALQAEGCAAGFRMPRITRASPGGCPKERGATTFGVSAFAVAGAASAQRRCRCAFWGGACGWRWRSC